MACSRRTAADPDREPLRPGRSRPAGNRSRARERPPAAGRHVGTGRALRGQAPRRPVPGRHLGSGGGAGRDVERGGRRARRPHRRRRGARAQHPARDLGACPECAILAECANGIEAVRAAGELAPDVVFLDIEMPKLYGFEVLELLDPKIAAVFVTAYDDWAVKAFEVHAVDYVLKPFNAPSGSRRRVDAGRERLSAARAAGRRSAGGMRPGPRERGSSAWSCATAPVSTSFRSRNCSRARAQDDYVELSSEGKTYLKAQTLASLAAGAGPETLRARAPLPPRAVDAHSPARGICEGQLRRDPGRRIARPGQPRGPRPAENAPGLKSRRPKVHC